MTERVARAPAGLRIGGRRLWRKVVDRYELEDGELVLLHQACLTVDLLSDLETAVRTEGAIVEGKVHPAVVEARLQRELLGRLLRQLALPEDEADDRAAAAKFGRRGAIARWHSRPKLVKGVS